MRERERERERERRERERERFTTKHNLDEKVSCVITNIPNTNHMKADQIIILIIHASTSFLHWHVALPRKKTPNNSCLKTEVSPRLL